MPACICPEFTADSRVGDHEADCIRNFGWTNQSAELGVLEDIFFNIFFTKSTHHRCISKAWMKHSATYTMEDCFFG